MGAVHGVAGLERRDAAPPLLAEELAGLRRGHEQLAVGLREAPEREDLDRPGEVDLALLHDHPDPGVLGVGGLEHLHALVGLVDGVLLGDPHGGEDLVTLGVVQGDVLTLLDGVGGVLGLGQGNRDGPEQAVGHPHAVADAPPVGVGHEALEGREAPDAHHDQVADLTRGQGELGQRRRALPLRGQGPAFEQERPQLAPAVRID